MKTIKTYEVKNKHFNFKISSVSEDLEDIIEYARNLAMNRYNLSKEDVKIININIIGESILH